MPESVADEVRAERMRILGKWGVQNYPAINREADPRHGCYGVAINYGICHEDTAKQRLKQAVEAGALTYMHILIEEVAEAVCAADDRALRQELIQVAAVALDMIESIDRNELGGKP